MTVVVQHRPEIREQPASSVFSLRDSSADKDLQGNKGANLITMTSLGLPVPPAFVVGIQAYRDWRETGQLPEDAINVALEDLQRTMDRRVGQGLEVSVRSSAPVSMPGMMDTLLNLGSTGEIKTAIRRIFESWDNMRAVEYRRLNRISPTLGTAAIVQAMVYGNRDERSGTGVVFSRNPSTGDRGLFGEYLPRAQGEDIVSGVRTPEPVQVLKDAMPEVYEQLENIVDHLEKYYCDMQDVEFTVESGKLYILQTRSAKRSGYAAVRVAVSLVNENLVTREEAVLRITPEDIQGLLHKRLRDGDSYQPIVKGLNAAPGAVGGIVVFDNEEAIAHAKKGLSVILVRPETSPDDIQGIAAASGVLTQRGGLTSHAAIVTRGMGKPCVCGAESMRIDLQARTFTAEGVSVKEGEEITIDGTSGNVYPGILSMEPASLIPELAELMDWAKAFKRLGVMANADTPEMIAQALVFGAEGIGLCRTERMFNLPERLSMVREFIMAETPADRSIAIDQLGEMQTRDFIALFRAAGDLPIVIRLLDMPLHEFLPHENEVADERVKRRIRELTETNPMLGHRGVRLAVSYPEIYRMQLQAIDRARTEVPARVYIMVPQVITAQEVRMVKALMEGMRFSKFGVMLETVRSCMRAGHLAAEVDFFSFGTNDLTQAVLSFSREDAEKKFLTTYLELGILQDNPFEVLDIKGVGQLMETAIFWARRAKSDVEIGVCGEQAGEPKSIGYLHNTGVNYVSCSPFRIPVARLVAAQAAIRSRPAHE